MKKRSRVASAVVDLTGDVIDLTGDVEEEVAEQRPRAAKKVVAEAPEPPVPAARMELLPEEMQEELAQAYLVPGYVERQNERAEQSVPLPDSLPPALVGALHRLGHSSLYSHQAETCAALRSGKSVAVTTPTASGKSLAVLVPVLATLLEERGATALFLFSLRALLSDQRDKLTAMLEALPASCRPGLGELHGPGTTLEGALQGAPRLLLATPDKLHYVLGKVRVCPAAQTFFRGLRFLVLDEAHSYTGAFGAVG
jgi:DEAD/DEAH box helicase domain-containing protein